MFAWLGWIAFTVFLGVSSYSVYCRLFTDLAIPGWTSQLVTMSFFAALNALGISMLGEYVVRIYDQVRGRPLYLVDQTMNFADASDMNNMMLATAKIETMTESNDPIDLARLDPLEIDRTWDHAYQHLLDDANDLVEFGALARAEADDYARNSGDNDLQVEDADPAVLKFTDSATRK